MKDKVLITIELERNENGTMNRKWKVEGENIRLYEIVGLLQMTVIDVTQESYKTAKKLPKTPTRIKYE